MILLERQILTRFRLFFILQKIKNLLHFLLMVFRMCINDLTDAEEEIEEYFLIT